MNKKHFFLYLVFFSFASSLAAYGREVISSFESDIAIQPDGMLHVTEAISVFCVGSLIKHGIYREFPTVYKDRYGNNVKVAFSLQSTLCDGVAVANRIKKISNGIRIYLGDKKSLVSSGMHTYTIVYRVNKQIGFFEKFDELYWNVTGNGWVFPIEKVRAVVRLPQEVSVQNLTADVYTGYMGSKESAALTKLSKSYVEFVSTRLFLPQEGLTFALTWPKGIITPPTPSQQWLFFFQDNLGFFLLLIILLICLYAYGYELIRYYRLKKEYPIIPRFEPPRNLEPAAINYVMAKKYTNLGLASQVVNLAVKGFITIDYKKKFLFGDYVLKKIDGVSKSSASSIDKALLKKLFDSSDEVILSQHKIRLQACKDVLDSSLYTALSSFFGNLHNQVLVGGGVVAIGFFVVLLFDPFESSIFFILAALFIHCVFYWLLNVYTNEGRELKAEIEGFKLFLSVAEVDRMNVAGTPPVRTPQLYEKYLPYAIALGVEKQWTDQFAPIFNTTLSAEGHPYAPMWYVGNHSREFRVHSFSSHFSSSISSAATPPGSGSGSGGRGSSGGGGGGGGGGGW